MSSSKPSVLESDSREGHGNIQRHASAQDGEEAPLLVDGALDDDIEANGEANGAATTNGRTSKTKSFKGRSQHAWRWILQNLIVVAVACLLVAGIIALCVYFGGERGSFSSRRDLG